MGRNVGVAGRDIGVGIELVVVVVLKLPPESRDEGRRRPEFVVFVKDWGASAVLGKRNEVGAVGVGLVARRLSPSRSFRGDGESSMIRTQPDESPPLVFLLLSDSLSLLRRESALRRWGSENPSQLDLLTAARREVGDGGPFVAFAAAVLDALRDARLPIRNRGTRV